MCEGTKVTCLYYINRNIVQEGSVCWQRHSSVAMNNSYGLKQSTDGGRMVQISEDKQVLTTNDSWGHILHRTLFS